MPFELLLIALFVIIFAGAQVVLWRHGEELFMVLLGALFIYTIFTQIGYVLYPEIPQSINVYVGREAFWTYWCFITASFVFITAIAVLRSRFDRRWCVRIPVSWYSMGLRLGIFHSICGLYVGGLVYHVGTNFDAIGYARIEVPVLVFFIFRQPIMAVLLYAKWKHFCYSRLDRVLTSVWLILVLCTFFVVAARAGQRLVVWCFFIGMAVYTLFPLRVDFVGKVKRLVVLGSMALVLIHFSNKVVEARSQSVIHLDDFVRSLFIPTEKIEGVLDPRDAHRLVGGDYFVPSSVLFVMIEYEIVDFVEVVRSNLYNSLLFMKYPQLAEQVSSRLMAHATRNEGYAYYILNEGYHALGFLGFIYNAIIINLGFWVWSRTIRTDNPGVNKVMTALIAVTFLSIVRAPSFYFVKDLYLTIGPAFLLVVLMARPVQASPRSRRTFVNATEARG